MGAGHWGGMAAPAASPTALAALAQYSLLAPEGRWGPTSDGRWRWAVDADAWRPASGASGAEFQLLLSLLPEGEERAGPAALPGAADQRRSLLGRLLSRRACARAAGVGEFAALELGRTRGKKPFLLQPLPDGLPNFNFNVSHDGRWVVLASDPLRLVGVDVAAPQRWRNDAEDDSWMEDLFELLSDSERLRVRREDSVRGRYSVFQRLWSAKEAVTKAVGRGLDFSIERIEVALDGEVQSAWPDWMRRGGADAQGGEGERAPREHYAEIHIDGWPRPEWRLEQHALPDGHWATVALGPVEEAVDKDGVFSSTLRLRGVDVEARRRAAEAPAARWDVLAPADLVPASAVAGYRAARAAVEIYC